MKYFVIDIVSSRTRRMRLELFACGMRVDRRTLCVFELTHIPRVVISCLYWIPVHAIIEWNTNLVDSALRVA